jgi:tellurium resistance protein TerD
MAISLSKGGNISLSKEAPGLAKITVGLGWEERATDGASFDLDASGFVLGDNGKVRSDADFIFYNQPGDVLEANQSPTDPLYKGTRPVKNRCFIFSTGDEEEGSTEDDGPEEEIVIDLTKVPDNVKKISVCVTIHDADLRGQNFGMVSDAYVNVVNDKDGKELARYDLSEDMSIETAMIFAEVYRHGGEWKFKAIGQGFAGGLGPLARNYGVNI